MTDDTPMISRRSMLRALGAVATLAACGPEKQGQSASDVTTTAGLDSGAVPNVDAGATSDAGLGDASATDGSMPDAPTPDAATAADAAIDAGTGLPAPIPHITPNADHFVTSCCTTPHIDIATWSIALIDRGKPLGTITQKLLDSLKPSEKEHTLECISASPYHGSISNAIWTGLPLVNILAKLGVQVPKGVTTLKLGAADGYTTAIPVTDLQRPIWLVWRMNGEEIPLNHGYPARLLLPGRYGTKNPKWLTSLEFLDTAYTGYWEETGWSDDATYKPNTLVRSPATGAKLPLGLVRLQGTAFAGSDPVVAVDVRVDAGGWQPASIDYAPGADIWTLWHYDWQAANAGTYKLQARCTTKSGVMSLLEASPGLSGYDGSMTVTLTVG